MRDAASMAPGALVIGESLVDVVRGGDGTSTDFAGGSAANVAVALARLGRPVRFATSWGDDDHGRLLRQRVDDAGIELAVDPQALPRTATAVATIGSDGAASYEFDLGWRLNPLLPGPDPEIVHVCSLGAVIEPGATTTYELVHRLRAAALTVYDVNARPSITGTGPDLLALVSRMAAVADLVKASDDDLVAL